MPPKKDAAAGEALLVGFTDKETKLLAAAFVSSTAPDKFDYDVMAKLTGNTNGSLKKMWPPVKKKALEGYASFAAFLGQAYVSAAAGGDPKPATLAKAVQKRKAADEVPEEDFEDDAKDLAPPSAADKSEGDKSDSKKKAPAAKKEKKAPAQKKVPSVKGKGRPKKATKKEESASEEEEEAVVKDKSAEDSADGGDGLGDEIEDDI